MQKGLKSETKTFFFFVAMLSYLFNTQFLSTGNKTQIQLQPFSEIAVILTSSRGTSSLFAYARGNLCGA